VFTEDPVRAFDEPPFGAYAPTPLQSSLIALTCATPLRSGKLRWWMSRLIENARPGPIDVERLGLKLRLHYYGSNASEKKMLLAPGGYDRAELAAISRHLSPGFHFADLGANAGVYALTVRSRQPDAKIIAFEALLHFAARLAFNVAANRLDNFSVIPAAVGRESGTAKFFSETGSLTGRGDSIEVEVRPLFETLLQKGFRRLDGMKIDIEGFEDRVLVPFFENAPREFHPRILVIEHTQVHAWEADLMAKLQQLGYRQSQRTKANTILELA
jgi:FkbM family methyltransferase